LIKQNNYNPPSPYPLPQGERREEKKDNDAGLDKLFIFYK
jgi:hypothetical protein